MGRKLKYSMPEKVTILNKTNNKHITLNHYTWYDYINILHQINVASILLDLFLHFMNTKKQVPNFLRIILPENCNETLFAYAIAQ